MTKKKSSRTDLSRRKPERILALDVSSVCVGFSVFEGKRLSKYGKYVQQGKEHGERLAHFDEWLTEQFSKFVPQQVIIEMPYSGRRRFTFGVLMMYFAIVISAFYRWAGYEMPKANRITASMVKRRMRMEKGSSHAERKRMMVEKINEVYGLALKFKATDKHKKVSDDDIADAIAVARAWLIQEGIENE